MNKIWKRLGTGAVGIILAGGLWTVSTESAQRQVGPGGANSGPLFPFHELHSTWRRFPVKGYSQPVTGVIYRGEPRPTCGMPLGGIDTGCLDIEPNGMLGYSTIFNHFLKPRLIINQPFLGLSVGGKTWVLVSDRRGKIDTPTRSFGALFPPTDYTPRYFEVGLEGVEIAESIDYWGHYPILDMQYKTAAPVIVSSRMWTPFIPGDTVASMVPGIFFEITLQNESQASQKGTLVFSFPGFETPKGATKSVGREIFKGALSGLSVVSPNKDDQWEMSYALVAAGENAVRVGGPLNSSGPAWAAVAEHLPEAGPGETGSSLGVDFSLQPGANKTLQLIFAWRAPNWKSGGAPGHDDTATFTHMYAKHYSSARVVAEMLARDHETLLGRIIAWQEAIYQDPGTPGWLADSLINILHLITEDAVWGQSKPPLDWAGVDGVFGMNECPRGSPQIECLPCSFYGNIPLVYFFPETALSTLRAYKKYQFDDGRPPWVFGTGKTPYDLAKPVRGYQSVLNGACYVVMVDRYWRVSGDDRILREFWDSLKRANDWSLNLRPSYGLSQIMAMPTPGTDRHGLGDTEWFEAPEPGWKGYVTHAGAIRMAQVMIMRRMSEKMGDKEYLKKCTDWLEAGSKALEEHLWAGQYYLNFHEPETKTKSDLVFGYQLDGEWVTDWHGVPGIFPKNRLDATLATILKINCGLSQSGCVNYANPDGTVAKVGGYGPFSYFPPELFMLSMNFMYEGQSDHGVRLLQRSLDNMSLKWGYTWDAINTTQGDKDTGQRAFGADYYQDMMLWAVPAALNRQDLTGPTRPGGLVYRVLEAGKGRQR
jgi:uncharacterized protein (DUF608 family)